MPWKLSLGVASLPITPESANLSNITGHFQTGQGPCPRLTIYPIVRAGPGYYGDRGDICLSESSTAGAGFLSDVCRDWEAAALPAEDAGIRVVHLRIGVIISRNGGALPQMLTPFKLGVGGRIGSGRQFWSWVTLEDVVGAIHHVIDNETVRGAVNCVAPEPVTNNDFTKTLGAALGRPSVFPMPAFAARLALGQMANDLLLSSTRVFPRRLESSGYDFLQPNLAHALETEINAR